MAETPNAAPSNAAEDFGAYGSSESVKSELSFFDGPSYQVTHLRGNWLKIAPQNNYQGSSGCNIEYKLCHAPGWYWDFNDSYLTVKAKIETEAGTAVAEEMVAFENYGAITLFKDVAFTTANQTKIEGENQNYHYRGYLYALLNAAQSTKKYQLSVAGWERDEANKFDATSVLPVKDGSGKETAPYSGNSGFIHRRNWSKNGGIVQFCSPVFLDTWIQKQYFPDGEDFYLTLKLSEPAFALHAQDNTKYKINILECLLWARQVNVSPSVLMGHVKGLQKHNFVVPYNGHKVYNRLIKAGGVEERIDDVFKGVFPKCVIIGLVDHLAYCGSYKLNPYNFQHFNLSEIGLTFQGNSLPGPPYTPNFATKTIAREYYNMFLQLGRPGIFSDDNGISMADWSGGNTLYCFNLAADLCIIGHAQLARYANLALTMKFSKALEKPIQLVALAIYDTHIEMTRDRMWILDQTQAAN